MNILDAAWSFVAFTQSAPLHVVPMFQVIVVNPDGTECTLLSRGSDGGPVYITAATPAKE